MKPNIIADTKKDPTKRPMPLETVTAPLGFGGEVVLVDPDSEGGEGEGFDGVVGGVPLGVVGGVPLAAATLICSFMPPAQWPEMGHKKYLLPGEVNSILEFPSW